MRSKRGRVRTPLVARPKRPTLWEDVLAALWLLAVVGAYLVFGFPRAFFR